MDNRSIGQNHSENLIISDQSNLISDNDLIKQDIREEFVESTASQPTPIIEGIRTKKISGGLQRAQSTKSTAGSDEEDRLQESLKSEKRVKENNSNHIAALLAQLQNPAKNVVSGLSRQGHNNRTN